MFLFISFIHLSPVAGSKEGYEIWRKSSLVTDEVQGGEVLACTTCCPKRGMRKGNERGKRHFEESVGAQEILEKGM